MFTVTCQKKIGSVGRDFFFFFNSNVYKGCCKINDTGAGQSGREITAKSDAKII